MSASGCRSKCARPAVLAGCVGTPLVGGFEKKQHKTTMEVKPNAEFLQVDEPYFSEEVVTDAAGRDGAGAMSMPEGAESMLEHTKMLLTPAAGQKATEKARRAMERATEKASRAVKKARRAMDTANQAMQDAIGEMEQTIKDIKERNEASNELAWTVSQVATAPPQSAAPDEGQEHGGEKISKQTTPSPNPGTRDLDSEQRLKEALKQGLEKLEKLEEQKADYDAASADKLPDDFKQELMNLKEAKTKFDEAKTAHYEASKDLERFEQRFSTKSLEGGKSQGKENLVKQEQVEKIGYDSQSMSERRQPHDEKTYLDQDMQRDPGWQTADGLVTEKLKDLKRATKGFITAKKKVLNARKLSDLRNLATDAEFLRIRRPNPSSPSEQDVSPATVMHHLAPLKAAAAAADGYDYWDLVSAFMYAVSDLGDHGIAEPATPPSEIVMPSRKPVRATINFANFEEALASNIFNERLPSANLGITQNIPGTYLPFYNFASKFEEFRETLRARPSQDVDIKISGSSYEFYIGNDENQFGVRLGQLATKEVALLVALDVLRPVQHDFSGESDQSDTDSSAFSDTHRSVQPEEDDAPEVERS
ncbi:unnamed protein product [Amoebophrya sp. A25]|nr:unnamed protein product [Amoebophrya sp. A25]|eukprot:GSA25T00006401001.1